MHAIRRALATTPAGRAKRRLIEMTFPANMDTSPPKQPFEPQARPTGHADHIDPASLRDGWAELCDAELCLLCGGITSIRLVPKQAA